MKTLYLVRHAKSSWSFDDLSDRERPLNNRGRADAPLMGQALHKRGIVPDVVVSSPAVRALSTAVLLTQELGYPHDKIRVEPTIYEADEDTLLGIIRQLPDAAASVLLVGHNPTITDVANALSTTRFDELTTAAVVCLQFQTDTWAEVGKANGECYFSDSPKEG